MPLKTNPNLVRCFAYYVNPSKQHFPCYSSILKTLVYILKAKAVPPHAIKALGGRGDIAFTHS
jgi:hypothetical protein